MKPSLTDRQLEIVIMVGKEGKPWAQVCRELSCHPSTVRAHVRRVMKKMDIKRKPREAMVVAYYELKWTYKMLPVRLTTWGD